MKKINLFICGLAIAGLGFTSCSDDDNDSTDNNDVKIEGTYNLNEVNTPEQTDFNKDGNLHTNQKEETDCYNDSKIVLNADGTFTYQRNYVLVNTTDGTFACAQGTFTGAWERISGSGDDALIQAVYETDNGTEVTLNLIKNGKEITYNDLFGQYPNRNDAGGAVYETGNVEYVFNK